MAGTVQVVCPECDAVNRIPAGRLGDSPRCGACKAALFQGKPLALDEARFRRHLASSGIPLLVDFWASWCGPCRTMAPQFEAAALELEPQMRCVKVSTEEAPGLASELRISSIPTLMLFTSGREAARQSGAISARQIVQWARGHAPVPA
jgi:thioredoxin 2